MKSLKRIIIRKDKTNYPIKEKILTPQIINRYYSVTLKNNGNSKIIRVHRLVAQAFIPNTNDYKEINHIDENKLNNKVDNLEWCDRIYNIRYSLSKSVKQYDLQGNYIKTWECISEASGDLKIDKSHISDVCKGKRKTAGRLSLGI